MSNYFIPSKNFSKNSAPPPFQKSIFGYIIHSFDGRIEKCGGEAGRSGKRKNKNFFVHPRLTAENNLLSLVALSGNNVPYRREPKILKEKIFSGVIDLNEIFGKL